MKRIFARKTSPVTPLDRVRSHPTAWAALILFLAVAVLYLPTLFYEPILYDDADLVMENPLVRHLDAERLQMFFTPGRTGAFTPLRWISYGLDWEIGNGSPAVIRGHNIGLYFLTIFLLFLFLRAFLASLFPEWRSERRWSAALFAALLFTVHPVHVESVVWLSARKEVLMGVFFFGGLRLHLLTHSEKRGEALAGWAGSFLCFGLALLSKPFAIVYPVAMALTDLMLLPPSERRRWLARVGVYLPFALLNLWYIRTALWVSLDQNGIASAIGNETFSGYIPNRFYLMAQIHARYLGLLFWPDPLTVQYLYKLKHTFWENGLWFDILAVTTFLVASLALAFRRDLRRWSYPGLFFFGCLIPASGLVPTSIYWADRYLFLAALGPLLGLAMLLNALHRQGSTSIRKSTILLGLTVLLVLAAVSGKQARHWENSETLFRHTLEGYPRHHLAAQTLAKLYITRGDLEKAKHFNDIAYKLHPADDGILAQRGVILYEMKQGLEAVELLIRAAGKHPEHAQVRLNLGLILLKAGEIEQAVAVYRQGFEKGTRRAVDYDGLARFLLNAGKKEEANRVFRERKKRFDPTMYPPPPDLFRALESSGKKNTAPENANERK